MQPQQLRITRRKAGARVLKDNLAGKEE